MPENNNEKTDLTVFGTPAGVIGAKSAIVVNEVVDNAVDGTLSFGKTLGRGRAGRWVGAKASDVKANTQARIAEAGTDEAKAAREDKAREVKAQAGEAGARVFGGLKKLGSKIPVSIELREAVQGSVEHVKGEFAAVDDSAALAGIKDRLLQNDIDQVQELIDSQPCSRCEEVPTGDNYLCKDGRCYDCADEVDGWNDPDRQLD